MVNKIKLSLRTTSDFETLKELSSQVDVAPDFGYSKGEQLKYPKVKARTTMWGLEKKCDSLNLDSELKIFFKKIKRNKNLEDFIRKRDFHLSVICYLVDDSVDLSVKKETFAYISSLNCSYGIDYFILPPEDHWDKASPVISPLDNITPQNKLLLFLVTHGRSCTQFDLKKSIRGATVSLGNNLDKSFVLDFMSLFEPVELAYSCDSIDLAKEISTVLNILRKNKKLEEVIKTQYASLHIVCFFLDRSIDVTIDQNSVNYIARLGIDVVVDYYIY